MSADSQPVELLDGRIRILHSKGSRSNDPIIVRRGGGFVGLVGYVGRVRIGGMSTRAWLERFSAQHPADSLPAYCSALASALTSQWQRQRLKSGLWIFLTGIEDGDVRFRFVCNVGGVNEDGTYKEPSETFIDVNDLDENYIPRDLAPGQTKEQLLKTRIYFFRNGVLRPTAQIFDAFSSITQAIQSQRIPGFRPIRSLDDMAFVARQRMEFAKRLYSSDHGIYTASSPGIAGVVHVLGVTRGGEIMRYRKLRQQIKSM